jgi:hypothetical protein
MVLRVRDIGVIFRRLAEVVRSPMVEIPSHYHSIFVINIFLRKHSGFDICPGLVYLSLKIACQPYCLQLRALSSQKA